MPNFYLRLLSLLIAVCALNITKAADANGLSVMIERSHNDGVVFQPVSLFTTTSGSLHTNVLKQETLLQPNQLQIAALYEAQLAAISLKFTDSKGKEYVLKMLRSQPMPENANFGYMTHEGRFQQRADNGIHYQGVLVGQKKSMAAMSVFADGTIMALFADEAGNYVVGRLEDNSGNYILYKDADMVVKPDMPCGTREISKINNSGQGHEKTTGVNMCRKVQLYWECDYQFFQNKSNNLVTAQNHMTGLFNQVQALYKNDNISLELKSLYIWTTDDAYPFNTSSDGLDIFKGYWNGHNNGFDGDIAHFITMDASGNGGLAYLDVLDITSRNFAYAYSEIHASYSNVPTYSWSVMVLSHETGHNLGSRHTHWCGWNTGAGGSCGSIDNCTTQENGSSCSTCPRTFDNASPTGAWSGTIMSYCHLVSRGIGLANGFGPLPGALLRTNVTNTTNLKSVLSAKLTPSPICSNNGAITLVYNADNFGVAPYTYAWSNGSNTQNAGGISTAGNYTVTVTDSNGCVNTFNADVNKLARPGNGKATGYTLPVCCKNGPVTVTLTADLPTDIQPCQTVAWLRTTASLGTYAAAQAAFNTAAPSDIIYSTNNTAINNSTAATLNITSPTPCAAQSFYYTPFITRKAKAANNITTTVSVSTAVNQASTQIGKAVSLSDQSASATACDLVDTPTSKSLSVTISGYTGRANNLTILAQDPTTNLVWYRKTGLAGNGTYTIPLAGLTNPLAAMDIKAFDFNCSNSTTCTGSSLTISATRTVSYPAITTPKFEAVCMSGLSTQLGFRPDSCQHAVGIASSPDNAPAFMDVYPNPTNKTAIVKFYAGINGNADLKITDMLGKIVLSIPVKYNQGDNYTQIDVSTWAKGVYFISLPVGNTLNNVKLIVE